MRIALIVALLAVLPALAGESAPKKENFFKRAGKAIASDAKAGAKQAGKAYGDLGRSIGRGTVNTTRQVGREMKDSSKRTAEAAKKEF